MSILRTLRVQYKPTTVVALRILSIPIALLCNDMKLADELARYFALYVVDLPEPHAFRVYLLQGEPVFDPKMLKDAPRAEPGKEGEEMYYDAVYVVFSKAMLSLEYILLHASSVVGDQGGVAFASLSGADKSAVALALLDRGYRFVTNDRLFVRPGEAEMEMVGIPKKLIVNNPYETDSFQLWGQLRALYLLEWNHHGQGWRADHYYS